MATYKKTGSTLKKGQNKNQEKSTTAEVFDTLDVTASKSEQWIIKNQKAIFILLAVIVAAILLYILILKPINDTQEKEAADELAFPKSYFEDAISSPVAVDSLLTLGLNGADGKYGFLDISSEYSRTKAGNLANYYAGISYLKLRNYKDAITYLEKFKAEDELLGPVAKGAIGDAFSDIGQPEDALEYYLKAANLKDNNFSTPLFLFKAGNTAMDLGEYEKAKEIFSRIKEDFTDSEEGKNIDVFINKATFASKK
jgi:tetratricopeptide (TPR) repeat protein